MVLEINNQYHCVNKFVVSFLSANAAPQELIDGWKDRSNLSKLKSVIRKVDAPANPPRPKSRYIFFCEVVRQQIKQESPDMKMSDITCELGRRWQAFKQNPDPQRDKEITDAFEKDKIRYDTCKMTQNKDKNKDKLRSSYLYFCDLERKKQPNITMKELGVKWCELKKNQDAVNKLTSMFEKVKDGQ
jgi:hypothetical protein